MSKRASRETENAQNHLKEDEIFTEAVRIFKQKGYHATSVREIADAVGLQKGSLYHYLSSKEDLLFRIFERGSGALTQQLEEILAADDSAANKLHRGIEAHLNELCDQLDIFTVYLTERRALSGKHHAKVRAEGERHAELLEKIIAQGIRRGEFRRMDAKMAAHAILGMCNWLHQWYSPNGRLEPQEIARVFADLVVHGLQARTE
ncbi:MAG: TetR/AcrR family transcriptional regulator [Chloroflexi bacterium]|nr:TetR/AcrR family transcriptional regulator [Chloroflexota bacterium]